MAVQHWLKSPVCVLTILPVYVRHAHSIYPSYYFFIFCAK